MFANLRLYEGLFRIANNKITNQHTIMALTKIKQSRLLLLKYLFQIAQHRGITQKDIEAATGIDQANLSKMLNGKYCPSVDVFLKIAEFVGVDISLQIKDLD
ncbi:MAG: helix-turn-helix transcriptional regulator [Saprospiraceae bacterium]|nr:helix-turn-helix transcriptional regulator [Saprospiraceae bacterium]